MLLATTKWLKSSKKKLYPYKIEIEDYFKDWFGKRMSEFEVRRIVFERYFNKSNKTETGIESRGMKSSRSANFLWINFV